MKKLIATLILLSPSMVFAVSYVDVDDRTYMCQEQCDVDLGPPVSVRDSMGGWWAEVRKEAIEL